MSKSFFTFYGKLPTKTENLWNLESLFRYEVWSDFLDTAFVGERPPTPSLNSHTSSPHSNFSSLHEGYIYIVSQTPSIEKLCKTINDHLNLYPHAVSRCSLINYGPDLANPLTLDHNTQPSEWEHDGVAFSPNLTAALNL